MKNRNHLIILIQACVVLVMSIAAGYTLNGYGIQFAIIVSSGLSILGSISIVLPNFNPVFFSISAIMACVPELINHGIVDIAIQEFQGLGRGAVPIFSGIDPATPFSVALTIGFLEITGHLVHFYLHSLRKDYRAMYLAKIETSEIEAETGKHLKSILFFTGTSLILSMLITGLFQLIQPALSNLFQNYSSGIFILGLIATVMLAAFLYHISISTYMNK